MGSCHKYIDWFREHPLEDDLKLLKWSDEALDGQGYVDWYPFEHPQLGPMELGGWNEFYAFSNPPSQYLERELAKFPRWLVWHLLISPRLELFEASAASLGESAYRVRLAVQNSGWLPTYVMKSALDNKLVHGVVCEIELPEGASLASGHTRQVLGQVEGRAYKPSSPFGWDVGDPTTDRASTEWVVRAPEGGVVKLIARHDRAGVVRVEVPLS